MSAPAKSLATPHFALVVSDYNRKYTAGLLAAAQEVLAEYPQTVVHVPGAFEIPLQAQRLARSGKVHAILALGVIWQGKTRHAEDISSAITHALMQIGLENDIPVFHEVLTVKTDADARARCLRKKMNRGREAAEAALFLLVPEKHDGKERKH